MASKDEEKEKDSYRNEWNQIKDEITCSICDELFKEPKTLPCLHTFCKECIQASLVTAERMKGQITCPLCRSPIPKDGIASIPTNFATNRLIDIFNSRRTSDNNHAVKCDECDSEDGAVACMWCVECEKGLCEECYKPHTKLKSLKSHKTVTIDEFTKSPKAMLADPKPQYCSTLGHDGQQLELYCHTCSQLICRDCTYTDHPRGEHQFEFLKKVIVSKRAKIKEIATPVQSLLDRVQVAIKDNETSKQEVDTRCNGNSDKVRSFFKDLHKILDDQEAKVLQNIDVIRSTSHNSLDSQRKEISSLEEQLNNCNVSISGMIRSSNIDELLTYINWVDSRVTDLTSLVEHANFDPVCKGDSVVWCADHSVFTNHCQSLCHGSGPPHPPHCSVMVSACVFKSDPVVISVALKDLCGLPVTNQSQCLKIQSQNAEEFCVDIKVEEHTHGLYHISYHPKERKDHCITVTCNDTVLNSEDVNIQMTRDYTAIQQEELTIDEYGGSNFNHPWHIINGPNNELIVCDLTNQQVVVFNEQLQYSHVIGKGKLTGSPNGVAVDNMGHLYVVDRHCIRKFNMDGSLITQLGTRGSAKGEFNSPHGLAISRTGQLYVCDRNNHRVQVFKNDKFLFLFGKVGSGPDALNHPEAVTMNIDETQLFIADTGNHRIQVCTANGKFVCMFGQFTDIRIPCKLEYPYSIYYTPDDHLLVTSSTNVVLVVKNDGTFVTAIEGKERFKRPTGVVMRNNGQIVISGYDNNKLVVF